MDNPRCSRGCRRSPARRPQLRASRVHDDRAGAVALGLGALPNMGVAGSGRRRAHPGSGPTQP
ncbi:hypothetical protein [Streptomyces tunisiensis]|uniref:hypothetical protein n=1 Tax=Streptomyces tunisiensis TaxID=948699 RepID=UPI003D159435